MKILFIKRIIKKPNKEARENTLKCYTMFSLKIIFIFKIKTCVFVNWILVLVLIIEKVEKNRKHVLPIIGWMIKSDLF